MNFSNRSIKEIEKTNSGWMDIEKMFFGLKVDQLTVAYHTLYENNYPKAR